MKTVIATFMIFASCAFVSADLQRMSAMEKAMEAQQTKAKVEIKFERDGHQYTTFLVSTFAGLDAADAYALTYYSQYPDDKWRYSAPLVSVVYTFVPWRWGWRADINKRLHSLHGGDLTAVQQRRASLGQLIKAKLAESSANKWWEAGLMIHAFGDSFAHTKGTFNVDEIGYGSAIGHAADGHFPDKIANALVFPKYEAYVRALFEALTVPKNDQGRRNMEDYLTALRKEVCEPDEKCSDEKLEEMSCAIRHQAKTLTRFSRRYYEQYSESALQLKKADVQKVMDQIKATEPRSVLAGSPSGTEVGS